tara:strand:+ start:16 stop:321 length:306 start_codon:yes stop_codon:yes gene_type:complete
MLGLVVRGAGIALKGVGKALQKKGTSLTKMGSKKSLRDVKKFKNRRKTIRGGKRKSTNDPALTIGLALTGGAGAGLLGKKIMDDRNKPKTIKPKLGLPPKR